MYCRFCKNHLENIFIDLVNAPPSNSFLSEQELNEPEIFYPLKLYICDQCFLVQIDEYKKSNEIFSEKYAYFSSVSDTWVSHAEAYSDMIVDRLNLNNKSRVVEIASNDGYLLQFFKKKHIPNIGIEPSRNVAEIARQKGIDVIIDFFGTRLGAQMREKRILADLVIGNNVLAHVPDINDFVSGLKMILKKNAVITMEFPHLMEMINKNQFDTIYHEHYSYFSFLTVNKILEFHGLQVFDVEQLDTHGGSLRIYAGHKDEWIHRIHNSVNDLLREEIEVGMGRLPYYQNFQAKADAAKIELLEFLIKQKKTGKHVVAYGAAAKGNTLLNYCGIKKDHIEFVADASSYKQGLFLPGSHVPIFSPKKIKEKQPEFILILAWNLKSEIMNQLYFIRDWNGKFVVPIPTLQIC